MNEELNVARPGSLRQLLQTYEFQFKKQLGQNFLIDEHILDKIIMAADIAPDDGAFEVGPGAGVVTRKLAERARVVLAVEKDQALKPILRASLGQSNNVTIQYGDVLEQDLTRLWDEFRDCARVSVVANLPYYVTTPILFHLLESGVRLHHIVVMVQREVAERLVAVPGTKDYGALTVAVQYYAEVDKICRVAPGCFVPPPSVESEVVRLRVRSEPAVDVPDERLFFRVVRAAFAMRRKTLVNNLTHQFGFPKDVCNGLLEACQIDPMRRGETLNLGEFAAMTKVIDDILKKPDSSSR